MEQYTGPQGEHESIHRLFLSINGRTYRASCEHSTSRSLREFFKSSEAVLSFTG